MKFFTAFSGVDGAGKSTQIQLLEDSLKKRGVNVLCIWARGGYTPLFKLLKRLLRLIAFGRLPSSGKSYARDSMLRPGWRLHIWLFISIIDMFILYCLWSRLLHMLGYSIIFDRFLIDTELDFKRNFPETDVSKWLVWRLLLMSLPQVNPHFLLIVPPDVSLKRSLAKREPFPDSYETLQWRFYHYLKSSQSYHFFELDSLQSPQSVHHEVLRQFDL